VVGYGKLGGIELGYTSDLDLVFIHGGDPEQSTDGRKPVDNAVFFTRLGQRIVHILNTQTPAGQLYEVDMRLRPSGNSGLLVSTLAAFEKYQRNDAWTWEHQALVRARSVAGDPELAERVETLRRDILATRRDVQKLATEVVEMRSKMRQSLSVSHRDGVLDLKQGFGGIVDIEFMVQYAVLAWAEQDVRLAEWSDNVRILEVLAESGQLEKADCETLVEAYIELRSATHQLALQQQTPKVPAARFAHHSAAVRRVWETLFAGVDAGAQR
jgi:glutamate-ammonia-ligase adenylyltransferase